MLFIVALFPKHGSPADPWLPEPNGVAQGYQPRANGVPALWRGPSEIRGEQATIKINHSPTLSFCRMNVWNSLTAWFSQRKLLFFKNNDNTGMKRMTKEELGQSLNSFPSGSVSPPLFSPHFPAETPERQWGECNKLRPMHPRSCVCTLRGGTVICTLTEEWQLPRLLMLSVCQVIGLVGVTGGCWDLFNKWWDKEGR